MIGARNWIFMVHSCMSLFWYHCTFASSVYQNGGWETFSPREEISPTFKFSKLGSKGKESWLIHQGDKAGEMGAWTRKYAVKGGGYYKISALCLGTGLSNPRANRYVEVFFEDEEKKMIIDERTGDYNRPFYPFETGKINGWVKFEGKVYVPKRASRAIIRLFLRWEPNANVEWTQVNFVKVEKPEPRKVRLAATNFRPAGGNSGMDNCRMIEPFVKEAKKKKVDLLVLGECITTMRNGLNAETGAEKIPGPCVEFLANLAKKNDLYLVTSLFERDGEVIYNTAVILGPDGKLLGKYRKLCLARDEYREDRFRLKGWTKKLKISIKHNIKDFFSQRENVDATDASETNVMVSTQVKHEADTLKLNARLAEEHIKENMQKEHNAAHEILMKRLH